MCNTCKKAVLQCNTGYHWYPCVARGGMGRLSARVGGRVPSGEGSGGHAFHYMGGGEDGEEAGSIQSLEDNASDANRRLSVRADTPGYFEESGRKHTLFLRLHGVNTEGACSSRARQS
jgi:hypothetical protein